MTMKKIARLLLGLYLLVLIWILLFKVTISFTEILSSLNGRRNINLIPFHSSTIVNGRINQTEIMYNFLIFMPFGGLLGITDKHRSIMRKVLLIGGFSLMIEMLQFVLGLGATDATDLLMNTVGGLSGLLLYQLLRRFITESKLDRGLTILGSLLFVSSLGFVAFILLYNL
ncbi:VanZ family protein [Enterococcus florum]|uniref:VanZ family protein n=1 Tax=Enterococcus florum TaxID=2480627 RepID=A0A4P5P8A6_9ENTE|nr:VanZ family protein [Enterococcus florum]GCF92168.1 VanZ family protein [Enterococcus florum]